MNDWKKELKEIEEKNNKLAHEIHRGCMEIELCCLKTKKGIIECREVKK